MTLLLRHATRQIEVLAGGGVVGVHLQGDLIDFLSFRVPLQQIERDTLADEQGLGARIDPQPVVEDCQRFRGPLRLRQHTTKRSCGGQIVGMKTMRFSQAGERAVEVALPGHHPRVRQASRRQIGVQLGRATIEGVGARPILRRLRGLADPHHGDRVFGDMLLASGGRIYYHRAGRKVQHQAGKPD